MAQDDAPDLMSLEEMKARPIVAYLDTDCDVEEDELLQALCRLVAPDQVSFHAACNQLPSMMQWTTLDHGSIGLVVLDIVAQTHDRFVTQGVVQHLLRIGVPVVLLGQNAHCPVFDNVIHIHDVTQFQHLIK
jgi:hypothetical protein